MKDRGQREQLKGMMDRPIPRKKVGIVKLQAVKEGKALYGMYRFTKAQEAAEMIRPLVEYADREMVIVMTLDSINTPLGIEIAAVGGVNSCLIDVRSIFKFAILNNASGIVLFHNHPSGRPKESREDIKVTERIQKAANLLGIRLLDHIILGEDGRFKSLRDEGIITFTEDAYDSNDNLAEGRNG